MEFIKTHKAEIDAEINAIVDNIKKYIIVHKKTKVREFVDAKAFNLYALKEDTNIEDFMLETVDSFASKYLQVGENETIYKIGIYDGELKFHIAPLITVVIFEPSKKGYVKEIPDSRLELRRIVGGELEYIYVGREDFILLCNEEGMIHDLPRNRGYYGTIVFLGSMDGETCSLNEEQIQLIMDKFDGIEHYTSKSEYLKKYFYEHPLKVKTFTYRFKDSSIFISTDVIIKYILNQYEKEDLERYELDIKDVEENNKDIYEYLKEVGQKIANERIIK